MGMDLTGLKPTSEVGVYLRFTGVAWSPLWDYIATSCSDILTPTDVKRGSINMGHRISRVKALRISERLQRELHSGITAKYSMKIRTRLKKPRRGTATYSAQSIASAWGVNFTLCFSLVNVRKFAKFCASSGGFVID
jgi:hypothetical protein